MLKKIIKFSLLTIILFVVIVLLFGRERIIDDTVYFKHARVGFEEIDALIIPERPKLNQPFEVRIRLIPSTNPLLEPQEGIYIRYNIPNSMEYLGGSYPMYEIKPSSGPPGYREMWWKIKPNKGEPFVHISEFRITEPGKVNFYLDVCATGRAPQLRKDYIIEIPKESLNESKK